MRAPVWVFCVPFRNGLHGRCIEAAACTVATAVGNWRDPRASLSRCGWHGQGFGDETLRVGSGEKACYLDWVKARKNGLLKCRWWLLGLSEGPFLKRLSRCFGCDGALQDLCGWHAVARIRPTAFFQQKKFKLLVGRAGFFSAAINWHRGSLGHNSIGYSSWKVKRRGRRDNADGDVAGCYWCCRTKTRLHV